MKWQKFRHRLILSVCPVLAAGMVVLSLRSESIKTAFSQVKGVDVAQRLLQWELGDHWGTDGLQPATVLTLSQMPMLLSARSEVVPLMNNQQPMPEVEPLSPAATIPTPVKEELSYEDNGVPSQTVIPTAAGNYTIIRGVYVKNASRQTLDKTALSQEHFAATLRHDTPQVLIIHTHGSEAYTLPNTVSDGTYRSTDAHDSVIRVGDEVASTLSSYGISVLHDRALYDDPYYDGAYDRAADAIAAYQEKYPSLTYIIDLHRDAVQDAGGKQYKLISAEDPTIAQISMVMGSSHEGWEENLKLAIAVSSAVETAHPTVMRPITLRNSNYNQAASLGMILVEIGAAGNSLDEAIHAGRVFADGFAEAVINNAAVG